MLIYFVPRLVAAAEFERLGLGERFNGPPQTREIGPLLGPEGQGGTVFLPPGSAGLPQRPTWARPAGCDYWIGWNAQRPPEPGELARPVQRGRFALELCDGNRWSIPLVRPDPLREPGAAGDLKPQLRLVHEGGRAVFRPTGRIAERWRWLLDEADFVAELLERGAETSPPDAGAQERLAAYAADLLGVDYLIGRAEVSALGLYDWPTALAAALLSIDRRPPE